ncbi:MAG TPA: oligopeptide/dipeptide ABC transporter ATP-binding protein, partial [Terriglobales bacterium]|nr:oligopeptide/dipeptide ABC transporter ATP-binding protein [Terriglobales bacterium]
CHRIAILHEGEIVECGPTEDILECPQHPYTKKLIAALPQRPEPRAAVIARQMLVHTDMKEFARR